MAETKIETEAQDAGEAQQGIWTAEIRKAVRSCDFILVEFETSPDLPSYSNRGDLCTLVCGFREEKSEGKPYRPERRLKFSFPGSIRNGNLNKLRTSPDGYVDYAHDDNTYAPNGGAWYLGTSPGNVSYTTGGALSLIPIGGKLRFEVALDSMSNGYAAKALLHGDRLQVSIETKGSKKIGATLLSLDESFCAHNSARFGVSR